MAEEFSWNDDCVVIPRTDAIAVYSNPEQNIVIRQEGTGLGDNPDDQIVIIPRSSVHEIIAALKKEIGE